VRDGALVYASALGLADVENDAPATTDTVYRIDSVSKALTAVAALQLSEQEMLDLECRYSATARPSRTSLRIRALASYWPTPGASDTTTINGSTRTSSS